MSKALEDVVVLDLTTEYWASVGAALLGDFGAQVIRVESGVKADPSPGDEERQPWDYKAELAQRNKLSLAVDLSKEAVRGVLADLVGKSDVILTDWSLAELERLGVDYASLSNRKPELIYARGSGFGPKGPDRDLPPLDELAAARTGMMPILQQPGQPPVYAEAGKMYGAAMLALGIAIALHHRQETGEGQQVDASLFASNMYGASLDVQAFLAMGGERFLHPMARLDSGNPMSGVLYQASDGRWVCLTMPDTDRWWPAFAPLVDLDVNDPRFDGHEKRCGESRVEMIHILDEAFRRKPSSHWKRVLNESQLSADVIEEFDFPANDEQVFRNQYILDLDCPGAGRVKTLGFPVYMSETPARLDRMAPCRGQHSAQVLHDLLGYAESRIFELRRDGVIG